MRKEVIMEKKNSNSGTPKMIFSSYGFRSPIMRAKFEKVIPQDDMLCEKICLIIPYAGFNHERTVKAELNGLSEFGFQANHVIALDLNYDGVLSNQYFDYIYVPGGDPFKLLNDIKKQDLLDDIRDRVLKQNTIYIGVSAGVYIASSNIEYVKQLEDDNYLHNAYGALGLLPFSILCHSDHYSFKQIKSCKDLSVNPIITLQDDQMILYKDGDWEYVEE